MNWICHFSRLESQNKRNRKDRKILGSCQRADKYVTVIQILLGTLERVLTEHGKGTGETEDQRKNRNPLEYSPAKIRSLGDFKRFAVTQTLFKKITIYGVRNL